jgi:glutaredoxin
VALFFYVAHCTDTRTFVEHTRPHFATLTTLTIHSLSLSLSLSLVDTTLHTAAFQAELTAMTGQRTVPMVWLNAKFIGGNDDMQKAAKAGAFDNVE